LSLSEYFIDNLEEIKVWNKELTSEEIANVYKRILNKDVEVLS